MKHILEKLADKQDLTREECREALQLIIDNQVSPAQVGAFLMGLRQKGETPEEINGFLDLLNERMVKVNLEDAQAIDVCGTGGDCKGTFNVSTAVAFVLAAGGVTVAKHGNRSISSNAGSADVLEKLGINVKLSPEQAKQCADEIKITFFYAPLYHPVFTHIGPHRRSLGIRTVFNMLGPLLNPANVKRQLIGTFDRSTAEMIARVLKDRGHQKAYIVHSEDGFDEISPFAKTHIYEVDRAKKEIAQFQFESFKKNLNPEQVKGSGAVGNALKISDIFKGRQGADREMILLNAAFAFLAAGRVNSFEEGYRLGAEIIDSGLAAKKVDEFREFSNAFETEAVEIG
ncbi:MAG: anthranilate phosphoribosyltransferase [Calditrichaeota bacterium]|nr:anthranilate phosphoribosyltransferase [Calditrichota bacterium]